MKDATKTPEDDSNTSVGGNSEFCDISLDEAIEEFIYAKKAENVTEDTIIDYEYAFSTFQKFLDDDNPSIEELDYKIFRKYLLHLQGKGLSPHTVNYHYRHLNAFFNLIVKDGYLKNNPFDHIKEPKTPKTKPTVLEKGQVEKLLETAKASKDRWSGHRNYAMLVVFIKLGLRLNELISAELDDLDMQKHQLKVIGKGRKERNVTICSETSRVLRKWLDRRSELEKISDNNIFISEDGEKLKRRNVQRIVTRIQKKAGLEDEDVSPHVLRRTSATLIANEHPNPFHLMQKFGWNQLSTALKYVNISDADLKDAMNGALTLANV